MSPAENPPPPQVPDLTAAQFSALLAAEEAGLLDDVRPKYERYRIAPLRMEHRWTFDGRLVTAPLWIVARDGVTVLGYDEVEDEWGIGRAHDGVVAPGAPVEDFGTFGERLRWTLLRFPDPTAYISPAAG